LEQKAQKETRSEGNLEVLEGTLTGFTFRNPDTGFAVVRFLPDGPAGTMPVVGQLAQLAEGQRVKITGQFEEHPRFGRQLKVLEVEAVLPSSIDGIRAYLASSLIKGIGPATAERITDRFGTDTLRIIEKEPKRLREVKGLGKKRIAELTAAVRAQRDVQEVMVFLRAHGMGESLATRIVKLYGKGAAARIQANPYRLAEDVLGIGFRIADRLAMEMGLAPDAPERIQAGILFALGQAAKNGNCFLPVMDLQQAAAALLSCGEQAVADELPAVTAAGRVVMEKPPGPPLLVAEEPVRVYPVALHQAEAGAANAIDDLLRSKVPPLRLQPEEALRWFEGRSRMQLPRGQKDAVLTALRQPVSVITGGPGVGKTTIIRALVQILAAKDLTLLLAAPTGRAAKRLEESTGKSACTVHRLLEFQPGVNRFNKDSRNPLSGDLLVVDEASMLDALLAYNLFRAIPPRMKLVLVGDVNQLPAVGPGQVLRDLIDSGRVPVTRLTEIFRQTGESLIVGNAHRLLSGEVPTSGSEDSDFFFVPARSSDHTRQLIQQLVVQRIPKKFDLDPIRDIQVLCPMYRGEAGADAINQDLQNLLNPGAAEIERSGRRYRQGDKVMQIRNDYEMDLFNGDTGRITRLPRGAKSLWVRFGDRELEYPVADLDALMPAYAITVHRAQGSEYPAIVMPLTTEHFMMLRRNLLYTGITRGQRLVVLVGSQKAMAMAVRNNEEACRFSGLAERLRDLPRAAPDSSGHP
jgi:exodeoxyribonuclease V alpha subunit